MSKLDYPGSNHGWAVGCALGSSECVEQRLRRSWCEAEFGNVVVGRLPKKSG